VVHQTLSHARIVKLLFANNAADHLKQETPHPQEMVLNVVIARKTLDDPSRLIRS
jgi:hypothetical protein